jgi:hypothetical protein
VANSAASGPHDAKPSTADAKPKTRPATTGAKQNATDVKPSAAQSKPRGNIKAPGVASAKSNAAQFKPRGDVKAPGAATTKSNAAQSKPRSNVKAPDAAKAKSNASIIQTVSRQLGKAAAVCSYSPNVGLTRHITDVVGQKVIQSIEDAEKAMSTARPDLEKAKASKEDRNQVVDKAKEVASALLTPSYHVVHLLAGHGVLFPPCKQVSKALAVRVSVSAFRCTISPTHHLCRR